MLEYFSLDSAVHLGWLYVLMYYSFVFRMDQTQWKALNQMLTKQTSGQKSSSAAGKHGNLHLNRLLACLALLSLIILYLNALIINSELHFKDIVLNQ